ncbi:hypothetical protein [Halostella sp. PRR32]|uniref:hypothetical protein n=1 Tax=Halostella sp. PRR32 TaxID=3098147 RepID=UPI002B1E5939|nr:hypothetical protein [Halostella sp. PRR32]
MSTTPSPDIERAIDGCQQTDVTPVHLNADSLDSTAPEYLRDLKHEFAEEGFQPSELTVTGCFDADCSLATQEEIDRIRGYVRAASFLGAARVTISVDEVANDQKVRPALKACAERARRDGVTVELDAPITLE